jgi:hypothetical protein
MKGELKYGRRRRRRRRKTEENNIEIYVKAKPLFFYIIFLADDFGLKQLSKIYLHFSEILLH